MHDLSVAHGCGRRIDFDIMIESGKKDLVGSGVSKFLSFVGILGSDSDLSWIHKILNETKNVQRHTRHQNSKPATPNTTRHVQVIITLPLKSPKCSRIQRTTWFQ